MRVLVLGGAGMLGHKLCQMLVEQHDTWATTTDGGVDLRDSTGLPPSRIFADFDALKPEHLKAVIEVAQPEAVINCVGIVKQSNLMADAELAIAVNSTLPHRLDALAGGSGFQFIQLSTDCVFSGDRGMYAESDLPDATDLYGRSKLLGETGLSNALVVRTSMIGHELRHHRGLLDWLLSRTAGPVPGYSRAYFSGLPTVVLAAAICQVIERPDPLAGCYHVASQRVDKFSLLRMISATYGGPWQIMEDSSLAVDRSLEGARFTVATGIEFPAWPELIEMMHSDAMEREREWVRG